MGRVGKLQHTKKKLKKYCFIQDDFVPADGPRRGNHKTVE